MNLAILDDPRWLTQLDPMADQAAAATATVSMAAVAGHAASNQRAWVVMLPPPSVIWLGVVPTWWYRRPAPL